MVKAGWLSGCERSMRLITTCLLLAASIPWLASAETEAAMKARIARLENAVLAPCCYTEPVSRHNSEIALRIQLEIKSFVESGKSDREILDNYAALYGAKVLVDPDVEPPFWSQWTPWALTVAGTLALAAMVWRWRARVTAQSVPASSAPLPDVSDVVED
jgi:cytochrome c-type biogenesis protein CcmH/NrfF